MALKTLLVPVHKDGWADAVLDTAGAFAQRFIDFTQEAVLLRRIAFCGLGGDGRILRRFAGQGYCLRWLIEDCGAV